MSITADFNNDGYLDFIASTYSYTGSEGDSSYVFLNNGDGTFKYFDSFYSGGNNITLLSSGDFNNDGFNDLAIIQKFYLNNMLSIYMNQGDGSFEYVNKYEFGSTSFNAPYIAILDMNNDGFDDILRMNGENIKALFSNGDGSFSFGEAGEDVIDIPIGHYGKIKPWDVNHDNYTDIIIQGDKTVTPQSGDPYLQSFVVTYINQGDTTFTPASEYIYGSSADDQVYSIQFGDFNADLAEDILLKDIQNKFTILINNGDGSFSAKGICPIASTPFYYHYSAGDINGDGYDDISVSDRDKGIVSVYLNNGDEALTFSEPVEYQGIYYKGNYAKEEYSCLDVNNDGHSDLVFYLSSLSVVLNHGDGNFYTNKEFSDFEAESKYMAGVDLNSDDAMDIVTLSDNNINILYNDGMGGFLPLQKINTGLVKVFGLVTADFNDDGIVDIALSGGLKIFYGLQDGGFELGINLADSISGLSVISGDMADMNGDGKIDFALHNMGDLNIILSSNSSYQLETYPLTTEIIRTAQVHGLTIADIDQDNDMDIVYTYKGKTYLRFNDGSGDFHSKDSLTTDLGCYDLIVTDLNGDGTPDIAVTKVDSYTGNISVFLNNGGAAFSSAKDYGTSYLPNYTEIKSMDMDNDGDLDLIVKGEKGISVFTNDGNAQFSQYQVYSGGDMNVAFDIADFDQDSTLDLAVLSSFSGKQCIYLFPGSNYSYTSVKNKEISSLVVDKITLAQNYPNPFNPTTTINYQLPKNSDVTLSIYNILGQKVAVLVNSKQIAGNYNVQWNASKFPSGLYFYKLQIKNNTQIRKMMLIK
jgi:hypothetical protein